MTPPDQQATTCLVPESATIWIHGDASFTKGGTTWFEIDGNLYLNFHEDNNQEGTDPQFSFDAYINGALVIGPSGGLQLSTVGFLHVGSDGIAGEFEASFGAGQTSSVGSGSVDLGASTKFTVMFNTTRNEVDFSLPNTPTGQPPASIPGVVDNSVTIPAAPTVPGSSQSYPPEPYFTVSATAKVNIVNAFVLDGSFALVVAPEVLSINFDASLTLHVPGQSGDLLDASATGGLTLDSQGLDGALSVTFGSSSSSLPVTIGASMLLEINTTGSVQQVGSGSSAISIPAGANHLYADLSASGSLEILDQSIASASLDFTVTGESLILTISGSIDLPLFSSSLTVDGTLGIVGAPNPGLYGVLSIDESAGGGAGRRPERAGAGLLAGCTLPVRGQHHECLAIGDRVHGR